MTEEDDFPKELEPEFEEKSKSQLKRVAHELQDLGKILVELPVSQFKKFDLEPELKDAVDLARGIRSYSGKKRQLQFIGKLMRSMDVEPIRQQLDKLNNLHQEDTQRLHQTEAWRDRLLSEGNSAVSEFVASFPSVDVQYLRQLIRQADKEAKQGKPPKSKRLLFKLVGEMLDQK
ncbi:MAG: DUF615 domain-containing protein [Gammaproteobacteria bacterium]|nr:DUF615 domain-containing protein [Gammaproteobacteria bacterium]